MPSCNQTNGVGRKGFAILANLGLNCENNWLIISIGCDARKHVLRYIKRAVIESVDKAVIVFKDATSSVPGPLTKSGSHTP